MSKHPKPGPTLDQQARDAHAEILAAIQRYGLISWLAGHRAGGIMAKATTGAGGPPSEGDVVKPKPRKPAKKKGTR